MGIGSWLSRYVDRNLLGVFIHVEFLIALFGGSSAALLFGLFAHVSSFRVLLYAIVLLIGTLVGLEIPLLLRILKDRLQFKDLISKVFTFDYIGALLASLLFPLVLVPYLRPGALRISLRNSERRGRSDRALGGLGSGAARAFAAPSWIRRPRLARRRFRLLRADRLLVGSRRLQRGRHLRQVDSISADHDHASRRRSPPLPQRQSAIQFARRIPLSRIARPSRALRVCRTRAASSSSAAATVSRCAKSCATRKSKASLWSISIRR